MRPELGRKIQAWGEAIQELKDENQRLKEETKHLERRCWQQIEDILKLEVENEQLRKEVSDE